MELRALTVAEASDYFHLMKQLDQETDYMLYLPEERSYDEEVYQRIIRKTNEVGVIFGAFVSGNLVGMVAIQGNTLGKIRHSGYLVMGLLADFHGQGIGSALLQQAINWGKTQHLHRIELTVVKENVAAVSLYQKYGFEIEGLKRDSLLMKDSYYDEYYMGYLFSGETDNNIM